MKTIPLIVSLPVAVVALTPVSVFAADAAATPSAASPKLTTDDTDLGTLLDNPVANAVPINYIQAMIFNSQIAMARCSSSSTFVTN